ncbi:MAG: efflux RND transporter periplasmic adaptor subunit [Wenzhouxiangella sp.]|jgi:membrane fusion protein (multidrug efflux system)|nr:efflux RND transporter periplasmic adaptor subunit [Wenzhouxiangella sp.]
MNKRMILMLAAVTVLFGGIFGYKAFVDQMIQSAFDDMGPETVTVTASQVRSEQWTPQVEAIGTFNPVRGVELSLEMSGIVREVFFENGQSVEPGQRLLALDTSVDEARLTERQAALRLAELELERQRRLFQQRSISEAVLDRAAAEADQARAAVAASQASIDQKILRAPFTGRLGIRQVNPGQFLAPGSPIVSLQSLNPIFFDFTLPQRQLPLLSPGTRLVAGVDAFPDQTFSGEVTAIEPRVNESTRSFAVQATFDNSEERLRPGMFAHADLDLGAPREVLVVPRTAIRSSTYGDSVFVIEDEGEGLKVVQRFVRTGTARGDLIAVLDGLEAGDRVAASGLLKLQNNTPVQIDDDPDVQPSENPDPRPGNS